MKEAILTILLTYTNVGGLDVNQLTLMGGMTMEQCKRHGEELAVNHKQFNDYVFVDNIGGRATKFHWECVRKKNEVSI